MTKRLCLFICLSIFISTQATAQCMASPECLAIIDSDAYNSVIASDEYCCNVLWDEICQANYVSIGGQPNTTTPGCSTSTGCSVDPGCIADTESPAYNAVVTSDPFCCSILWDDLCTLAYQQAGGLPNPSPDCIPDCPELNANFGSPCDDGNPFTYIDSINENCICTGVPPLSNNSPCLALPVACGETVSGFTFGAAVTLLGSCGTTDGTAGSVWYTLTPTEAIPITLNTCSDSDFDTKIRGFRGDCLNLICVAGNDDFCGLQSQLTFNAIPGEVYYIMVHGYAASEGNFTLNVSCTPVFDCPTLGVNIGTPCTVNGSSGTIGADCTCIPTVTCTVVGGTISTQSPRINLCKGDGVPNIVQLSVTGNSGIGRFGLVRQSDLAIIATNPNGSFNMENYPAGAYYVGHISVSTLSTLAGVSNVSQLNGCYSLSNQLIVTSVQLSGGTITANGPTTLCEGVFSVSLTGNQGPNSRFALLNQNLTQVIASNPGGNFNVNNLEPGNYRVVHMSYTNSVNPGTIVPPNLPPCAVTSNIIQITKTSCIVPAMELHPNPTEGNFEVSFSTPVVGTYQLDIWDLSGRHISNLHRSDESGSPFFDVKKRINGLILPNGVYIVKLNTPAGAVTDKLIISR